MQNSAEARSAGANTMLKVALEAVELGKKDGWTVLWDNEAGPGWDWMVLRPGLEPITGLDEPTARFIAHAGTHYARLAEAYVGVVGALKELEAANDALCAGRSQDVYNLMIEDGQEDQLLALDRARANARALTKENTDGRL